MRISDWSSDVCSSDLMEECMVLSRSTVLTPFFVITAIQRLPSDAAQLTPSELGQTALLARLLMAAERAVCSRATISLADEASRLPRIRFAKLGVAMIAMMVRTARVTISSTRVNTRMADGTAIVGRHCSIERKSGVLGKRVAVGVEYGG